MITKQLSMTIREITSNVHQYQSKQQQKLHFVSSVGLACLLSIGMEGQLTKKPETATDLDRKISLISSRLVNLSS